MIRKPITKNPLKKTLLDGIENILDAVGVADNVEIKIKINKKTVPTISYKIDGFPVIYKESKGGDDFK